MDPEHTHTHHGTLRHIRKRRKHSRKLRDNPELLLCVIVMVILGLVLVGFMVYALSTRWQTPRLFR